MTSVGLPGLPHGAGLEDAPGLGEAPGLGDTPGEGLEPGAGIAKGSGCAHPTTNAIAIVVSSVVSRAVTFMERLTLGLGYSWRPHLGDMQSSSA
jgi:hypothetical protein